jgi:hypothetical protein
MRCLLANRTVAGSAPIVSISAREWSFMTLSRIDERRTARRLQFRHLQVADQFVGRAVSRFATLGERGVSRLTVRVLNASDAALR